MSYQWRKQTTGSDSIWIYEDMAHQDYGDKGIVEWHGNKWSASISQLDETEYHNGTEFTSHLDTDSYHGTLPACKAWVEQQIATLHA